MRDCYKKFWKVVLVEKIHSAFPQFVLKEIGSRRGADEIKPSAKPVKFVWSVIDKLTFTMEFAASGKQDEFEGYCGWSVAGKSNAPGLLWLHDDPFSDAAFEVADAMAMIQGLSEALGDKPRVFKWHFWEPTMELETSAESHAAWKAEFIAEELRVVSEAEARQRVEIAVDKALTDIKRCALPWFEKKLARYKKIG